MFDIFAKLLSSVATFLFPVFASYKALKTSDPALLTPWLMYWVVLACALLVESWAEFILVWIPFYPWLRAFFLLWLIAPQTQGAKLLYQNHVHPFLHEHELAIDEFISSAHDRAKEAGLKYLKQAIEFVKENLLGLPPPPPPPAPTPSQSNLSYAQALIARFNLPAARSTAPTTTAPSTGTSTATDFYSLLASAVSAATAATTSSVTTTTSPSAYHHPTSSTETRDLSNSGTLIPPTISGEERLSFIAAQRERLSILLSALDREASKSSEEALRPSPRNVPNMLLDGSDASGDTITGRPESSLSARTGSGVSLNLSKSRSSEMDFEKIGGEGEEEENGGKKKDRKDAPRTQRQSSGSWLPWSWGSAAAAPVPAAGVGESVDEAEEDESREEQLEKEREKGKSSAVEL